MSIPKTLQNQLIKKFPSSTQRAILVGFLEAKMMTNKTPWRTSAKYPHIVYDGHNGGVIKLPKSEDCAFLVELVAYYTQNPIEATEEIMKEPEVVDLHPEYTMD